MTATVEGTRAEELRALTDRYSAHNYHPLPVVVEHASGCWVTDVDGRRYLDMLSAYSALNFGHRHPRLVAAARRQLDRVTLTSRAFDHEQFGPFCRELTELTGTEMVLPMNTGAEAVETAIKVSRKWGYEVKGVPDDTATIIVCDGNFHGRTTTIVGFSTDPTARDHFGPYPAGFRIVPYGDAAAVGAAIDDTTVAVLVEPIQGEAGVLIPPDGYLRELRAITARHDVLLVADEIQSGLGRTGTTLACEHEGVTADLYLLGKALGGGILPASAVVGRRDVLGVLHPGEHGSTFGGNPLACAVAREVIALLSGGEPQARARELSGRFAERLRSVPGLRAVRVRGLWAGVDLPADGPSARSVCERLMAAGVLAKDTHDHTVRLAPPLTITESELDWGVDRLADVLT